MSPSFTEDRRHEDHRLSNIEASIVRIDANLVELSKAMISLARVEERQAGSHEKIARLENELGELRMIIRNLTAASASHEKQSSAAQEKAFWLERILWTLLTGGSIGGAYLWSIGG